MLFYFSIASGTCRAFHLKAGVDNCKNDAYFTDGQECLKACAKSSPTEQDLPSGSDVFYYVAAAEGVI